VLYTEQKYVARTSISMVTRLEAPQALLELQ